MTPRLPVETGFTSHETLTQEPLNARNVDLTWSQLIEILHSSETISTGNHGLCGSGATRNDGRLYSSEPQSRYVRSGREK